MHLLPSRLFNRGWDLLLVLLLITLQALHAADWPHQRGPDWTGCTPAGMPVPDVLPGEPRVVWKLAIGDGFAAPIISGGRVVFGELFEGKETFRALQLPDATKLWSNTLDSPHKDGFGSGPRCAAVSDGTVVVTQSCRGELHVLDAHSGAVRWRVNYLQDFSAIYTGEKGKTEGGARHGYSGSPCIDGDHVIALVGGPGAGVVCFDKLSGKPVWKAEDDQAGYSPPIVATVAGVRQVIAFTVRGLVGLRRDNGTLLWRTPMKTNYGRHVMAPIVCGDLVIAGSHEVGLIATRLTTVAGVTTAMEAWRQGKELGPNFSSGVLVGTHLYLLVRNQVTCLDATTGKECWRQDGVVTSSADKAFAAFIGMQDKILLLNDAGELILFKADPSAYQQISRIQACGKTWCHPAYADGMLVLRDAKSLLCLDLLGK